MTPIFLGCVTICSTQRWRDDEGDLLKSNMEKRMRTGKRIEIRIEDRED
jgi:hypothetical protein